METVTYFGIAAVPGTKKTGILRVVHTRNVDNDPNYRGRTISQEWTGEEFKSWKAAKAAMEAKNRDLFPTMGA
jgi:hypothetical protein